MDGHGNNARGRPFVNSLTSWETTTLFGENVVGIHKHASSRFEHDPTDLFEVEVINYVDPHVGYGLGLCLGLATTEGMDASAILCAFATMVWLANVTGVANRVSGGQFRAAGVDVVSPVVAMSGWISADINDPCTRITCSEGGEASNDILLR